MFFIQIALFIHLENQISIIIIISTFIMYLNIKTNPLNKYGNHNPNNDIIPQIGIFNYMRAKTCMGIIERKFGAGNAFGVELFSAVKSFSAFVSPPDDQIMMVIRDFLSDRVCFSFYKKI
jgi:hypothetical protein